MKKKKEDTNKSDMRQSKFRNAKLQIQITQTNPHVQLEQAQPLQP